MNWYETEIGYFWGFFLSSYQKDTKEKQQWEWFK